MLDYGRSLGGAPMGGDFSAQPRVIQGKPKYKDPYSGQNQEEYYPQNIMYDKRIARGSTYAAMVIPAGTNPDAMMMDKKNDTRKTKSFKRSAQVIFLAVIILNQDLQSPQRMNIYPNRDIPTPEPVPGRLHMEIQTEKYVEQLTDKPPEREEGVATEFYLDRPPVPLFQPKMPSKENCKATQIFDEDPELFDFDKEIEPMLNCLILKTLEQARMKVLEEEELKIVKEQRNEYEEIRNAELIEAQRLEAAELRRKQELERRRVQQKARKEEKRAAHKKHVARVMAKSYLVGLRFNALSALKDQGMLIEPIEQVMNENIMPWVLDCMADFIDDEDDQEFNLEDVIKDAFELSKQHHKESIEKEYQRRRDVIDEQAMKLVQKAELRQERRQLREQRRKEEELRKLREDIKLNFVDKGEVRDHILQLDIQDITGNFERNRPFVGAIGGQLMQLAIVIEAIQEREKQHMLASKQNSQEDLVHPEKPATLQSKESHKDVNKAQLPKKNIIDLVNGVGLYNLLLNFIKDMKNDYLQIMIHGQTAQLLESLKVNMNELHKLDENNQKIVKDSISDYQGYTSISRVIPSDYTEATTITLSKIVKCLVDILSKKLPQEVNFNNAKLEQVASKIKLISAPKNIHEGSYVDANTGEYYEQNTGERAIVRLTIPHKQIEVEEEYVDPETGLEMKHTVLKDVEVEQDDRALLIPARVDSMPYSIFVMNEIVPRTHRREFFNYLKKNFAEYFDGRDIQREIDEMSRRSDEIAKELDNVFVSAISHPEYMPEFSFEINLND